MKLLNDTYQRWFGVGISLLSALILSILPLPAVLETLWPDWLLLVFVYWVLIWPTGFGLGTVWIVAILADGVHALPLGSQALVYCTVIFIVCKLYSQIRLFPKWQQVVFIFGLALVQQILLCWILGLQGEFQVHWLYWLRPLTTSLAWLMVFTVLSEIDRRWQRQGVMP